MTKWEYNVITTNEQGDVERITDDRKMETVHVSTYLNDEGKRGWELVSVVKRADGKLTIFMKQERS